MVTQASDLAERAQSVVDGAQSEIDALQGLEKAKSGAAAAKMVKGVAGLPQALKDLAVRLQDEIKNLQELLEEMKDTNATKAHVEKAKVAKPSNGRDAYRAVFGGVYYTDVEQKIWKAKVDKEKLKINEADYKNWLTKEPKPKPQAK